MGENEFIHIDAPHLCVMENESDELCNDGIYGKALSLYLKEQMVKLGYTIDWIVCEDWGWYVPAKRDDFTMAVCVYGFARSQDEISIQIYSKQGGPPSEMNLEPTGIPLDLCVKVGTDAGKHWSWRSFRFIDRTSLVSKLNNDLITLFQNDPQILQVRLGNDIFL